MGLTSTGFPIEKRAQIRMRRLVGLIARQRIFLVLPSFNLLSEQDKMKNQLTVERRDIADMLMKRRKREMRMQGTKREMVL